VCRVVVFLCLQFHAAYAVRKNLRHHLVENGWLTPQLSVSGSCAGVYVKGKRHVWANSMVPGDKEWLWLRFRNISRLGHFESLDRHGNLIEWSWSSIPCHATAINQRAREENIIRYPFASIPLLAETRYATVFQSKKNAHIVHNILRYAKRATIVHSLVLINLSLYLRNIFLFGVACVIGDLTMTSIHVAFLYFIVACEKRCCYIRCSPKSKHDSPPDYPKLWRPGLEPKRTLTSISPITIIQLHNPYHFFPFIIILASTSAAMARVRRGTHRAIEE
jgi:hypothetical protein